MVNENIYKTRAALQAIQSVLQVWVIDEPNYKWSSKAAELECLKERLVELHAQTRKVLSETDF